MVCKSSDTSAALNFLTLASLSAASLGNLLKATMRILVDGHLSCALVDRGSSESFISQRHAQEFGFHVHPALGKVSMAAASQSSKILGYCVVKFILEDESYSSIHLSIVPNLHSDVILGLNFLKQHDKISVIFGGAKLPMNVCGLIISIWGGGVHMGQVPPHTIHIT